VHSTREREGGERERENKRERERMHGNPSRLKEKCGAE